MDAIPLPAARIPTFNRGCRLRDDPAEPGVLIPEGYLKLSAGGARVLRRCDGKTSVAEIVEILKRDHPAAETARIEAETILFLDRLVAKTVLVYK